MINMEKIDYVINRTGASYTIVREALLETDGDVDAAIEYIKNKSILHVGGQQEDGEDGKANAEDSQEKSEQKFGTRDYFENVFQSVDDVIDAIKEIWKKGNARRLLIEKDNQTILSLSLATSAIGLILGPVAAVIGFGTAYINDYDFKIIMENGEVIDIKEYVKERSFKK